VARAARITSHSYASLLPEPDANLARQQVSVQNHSYGTAIENYYGLEAQGYDRQSRALPALLHVFSAATRACWPAPKGRTAAAAVANLTGQFKMSKNSVSVGATDALGQVAPQSSRGPAHDGRVKPELVAFGDAGSSDAAALCRASACWCSRPTATGTPIGLPPRPWCGPCCSTRAQDVAARG
jgi:hypothetical protein